MAAMWKRWAAPAVAAALVLAAAWPAAAQGPAYRCVSRGTVTYTEIPCPGGREVGGAAPRVTDRWKRPPQDRAKLARRARLGEEDRKECTGLDARLAEQERFVRTRGEALTLQDEMPLVQAKKRFRELKC